MPKLIVVRSTGDETAIEGQPGRSVMELMRDNGVDEILALCGGCCSCGTCHVWVDPAFVDRLPKMASQENDLLSCSEHRTATSRLSCQLAWTDELDGLRVTLAPND